MFRRLIRPFKKRYEKYAGKLSGFIVPVKNALVALLGYVPDEVKSFVGLKPAESDSADSGTGEASGDESSKKLSLIARLKNFKNSLKEMSDFQKLILLTIAICLPAGILISTILVGVIKNHRKK